jgi:transcriptional regulator with XRE-family HTH domain
MSDNNQVPHFDPIRFAARLRRWRDAEDFEWADLAKASGLSESSIQGLVRGTSATGKAQATRQSMYDPRISTLARLSHGLGLDLSYMLSWGGLDTGGERWRNFSPNERLQLQAILRMFVAASDMPAPPAVTRMLNQLEKSLTETHTEDPDV